MGEAPAVLSPQPPGRRRAVVRTLAVFAGMFVLALLLLGLHFATTPSFAEHVRTRHVDAAVFDGPGPGVILAENEAWIAGGVDPFALTTDDPHHHRGVIRCTIELRHGTDVLLHLVQEVAVAVVRETGQRAGVGCRTVASRTAPGMRALVRTFLRDREQMLERGAGAVLFDVWLGAGIGANRTLVVDAPWESVPLVKGTDPPGLVAYLLSMMVPWCDPAPSGVLHRMQGYGVLCWEQPDGTMQGAAFMPVRHVANTWEYSCWFEGSMQTEGLGIGGTVTDGYSRELSCNGFAW